MLAARRAHPRAVAGRWELPGGKASDGESPGDAVVREIREELGCRIAVTGALQGTSRIDDRHDLVVHLASLVEGEPAPVEHDVLRWLAPEDLGDVDWLESDRPFLPELAALLVAGEPLPGGNVGGAVRIGATVRRPTGPWTPAVHALLRHLAAARLAAVPQVLGVDAQRREVLTFLPGRVPDIDHETSTDATLGRAMSWLRSYHDAVATFTHPGPWRNEPGPAAADQIVCHHDFAPYNVALGSSASGEQVVGVFDWDMAGPGTPVEDLAFAAVSWVPLLRPVPAVAAARRLRLMAAAYGEPGWAELILRAVVPRVERSIQVIRAGQAAGDQGMLNLGGVGEPARTARALADLAGRIPAIAAELAR